VPSVSNTPLRKIISHQSLTIRPGDDLPIALSWPLPPVSRTGNYSKWSV